MNIPQSPLENPEIAATDIPGAHQLLLSTSHLLHHLSEPQGRFTGLSLNHSHVPDNIVFFQRTDPAALRSVLGVSSNYHHRFELVVVFESGGLGTVGDKAFELIPGECVLLFPHQFHRFENYERKKIQWLFITFDFAETKAINSLRDRPIVMDAKALSLLQKILAEKTQPTPDCNTILEIVYTLYHLLLHLSHCPSIGAERRDIRKTESPNQLILEKINRAVRADLAHSFRIKELADLTGYSASHLRSIFRDTLGISLGKYLRESRLAEAARLLQTTDLQVTQVAQRAGFDSLVTFSRSFKNAYRLSPMAYAKLVRKGKLEAYHHKVEW
jgi:AraC-like DNA-binding protein/mannose-6-phosphate isomerase-like protein (cupin superfamily)